MDVIKDDRALRHSQHGGWCWLCRNGHTGWNDKDLSMRLQALAGMPRLSR